MKKLPAIIVSVTIGLTVLAGYFFQAELSTVLSLIVDWGILLAGVAGLIGLGYLVQYHLTRLMKREKGAFFSLITLLVFLFILVAGLTLTTQNPFYRNLILNIQVSVEASLLAVLAVTLMFASLKLIRTRGWTPMSVGFLISALISLVLNLGVGMMESGTVLGELVAFWRRLPIVGARGILLGMAIGGLIVGLRILLGMHRPYGEE